MKSVLVMLLLVSPVAAQTSKPSSRPGGEIVPPPRRDVPGKRIVLPHGELFVPDFFHTRSQADAVVWFLGAAWCAEQVFYDAHKNAVLLVANETTLKRGFTRPLEFCDLLEEIGGALNTAEVTDEGIGRVSIVSFSGGWTATRDVLSHPDLARVIDNVVLLDSLYARDKASGKIDPEAIAPFVEYAHGAADGAPHMSFVFTQLYPPQEKYRSNTTTVCATYLIEQLGLNREGASDVNARGAKLLYRAERNNCHILGYSGMTNQDHFEHFYAAADTLKLTSLPTAK